MEASTPFDSWDPMVLDSLAAVNKPSRTPAEEAAAQKQSVKSYWAAVNSKVCGSLRGWVSAFLGIYPSEFVGILDVNHGGVMSKGRGVDEDWKSC